MTSNSITSLISEVTKLMENEGITYAITGSIASAIHGEPVTSIDVDIVTNMTPDQAAGFAETISPRFYADKNMLRNAAIEHSFANLYDSQTGFKIDISVLENTPYHTQVLQRREKIPHPSGETNFWVVSPEDIILMKLVWRKDTESQKQWENALSVVRVKGNKLDWAYLRKWAKELEVENDLDRLAKEAGVH